MLKCMVLFSGLGNLELFVRENRETCNLFSLPRFSVVSKQSVVDIAVALDKAGLSSDDVSQE